jgi:O2-independent ubiquinone biosynthesis accessory factor UbiT
MSRPLSRVLRAPATAALVGMLDLALWRKLPADVRGRLVGRRVEIAVTDWGFACSFTARAWGFVPRPPFARPELRIAASAHDFGALAAGEEDADTLYFSRRLIVEGDTELALMVKNTLDALEVTRARALVRRAHGLARRLREMSHRRARAQGI